MALTLVNRTDVTLDAVRRVAWGDELVALAPEALERMRAARATFLKLLDSDPNIVIYGVTSGYGQRAHVRFTPDERRRHAARPPRAAGVSFGDPLPERVVRAIVLARLANFVEGHAAVRPELAQAVAGMLDSGPLPQVPSLGNGGAGEVLPLSHLFAELAERVGPQEKESLALINGSPVSAALVADAALAARARVALAHEVFALSAEAFKAPLEAMRRRSTPCGANRAKQSRWSGCVICWRAPEARGAAIRPPSASASCRATSAGPSVHSARRRRRPMSRSHR